jgi:hypothetical protein
MPPGVPTYPSSGDRVKFDLTEVLGRSEGPTVGRIRLLATLGIDPGVESPDKQRVWLTYYVH